MQDFIAVPQFYMHKIGRYSVNLHQHRTRDLGKILIERSISEPKIFKRSLTSEEKYSNTSRLPNRFPSTKHRGDIVGHSVLKEPMIARTMDRLVLLIGRKYDRIIPECCKWNIKQLPSRCLGVAQSLLL